MQLRGLPSSSALRAIVCVAACLLLCSCVGAQSKSDRRMTWETLAPRNSPRTNAIGLTALLVVCLVIAVGYLVHLMRQRREIEHTRRSLVSDLDRIQGYVNAPDLLNVGDRVEIEVEGTRSRRLYHSRVEDVQATTVELSTPLEEGIIVPLRVGQILSVVVRQKPYSFRFRTRVLSRAAGQFPTLTVQRRQRALRFQRREFLRVDVELEARLELRTTSDPSRRSASSALGTVRDLSGSGLKIETSTRMAKVRFFTISFVLPDGRKGPAVAECQVVASTMRHAGQVGGSTFGAQFIEVSNQHRDRIVKYVLAQERRKRRREVDDRVDAELRT